MSTCIRFTLILCEREPDLGYEDPTDLQFLRPHRQYLESCWVTWNHPNMSVKVTTYPMVHIGHESFYQHVSKDLIRCQFVLLEGVTWRSGNQRHPLYDLLARNLGLAAQATDLSYPSSTTKVNLDMSRAEFRKEFFELPLKYVFVAIFLRYLLWVLTLPKSFRPSVRQVLLSRRFQQTEEETPLDQLILRKRDRRIVENLRKFFLEHDMETNQTYAELSSEPGTCPQFAPPFGAWGFNPVPSDGLRSYASLKTKARPDKTLSRWLALVPGAINPRTPMLRRPRGE